MRKINRVFFTIILFLLSSQIYCQENINFVKDFEYLNNSIQKNCISYKLFCDDYGISGEEIYLRLKNELIADNTFSKFVEVSSKLFNISADKHNGFIHPNYYYFYLRNYVTEHEKNALLSTIDSSQIAISITNYKEFKQLKRKYRNKWAILKTTFWKGKYYLTHDYEIDEIKLPRGSLIKRINDFSPQDFYNNHIENCFPYYDYNTREFYSNNLTNIFNYLNDTVLNLTVELPSNEIRQLKLNQFTNIEKKSWNKLYLGFKNKVKYTAKNKTLYIRFFSLDFDFQKKQPIQYLNKYKNKRIDKIIIDLRGNGGGNDLMWVQLMSAIQGYMVPKEEPSYCTFNQSRSVPFFKDESLIDSVDQLLIYKNDILSYIGPDKSVEKNKTYTQINELYSNIPHLNYKGEIYCLIDDVSFSGALSFASLKYYFDNFQVVSAYSPYYGGMASTPILFMLPSSKLIYRLTSNFDYELYRNKQRITPDIPVDLKIDDILEDKNQGVMNYNSKKYLGSKNKYIKTIQNLKSK